MLITILLLSGALFLVDGQAPESGSDAFEDGFASLWCIFWIVATLGFDGSMGTGGAAGQGIIAVAIVSGLLFTTMPIVNHVVRTFGRQKHT